MNNSQNHVFTNEFDDIHISISLLAGTMRLYAQTEVESFEEQVFCLKLPEFVELVREFHAREQRRERNSQNG